VVNPFVFRSVLLTSIMRRSVMRRLSLCETNFCQGSGYFRLLEVQSGNREARREKFARGLGVLGNLILALKLHKHLKLVGLGWVLVNQGIWKCIRYLYAVWPHHTRIQAQHRFQKGCLILHLASSGLLTFQHLQFLLTLLQFLRKRGILMRRKNALTFLASSLLAS